MHEYHRSVLSLNALVYKTIGEIIDAIEVLSISSPDAQI